MVKSYVLLLAGLAVLLLSACGGGAAADSGKDAPPSDRLAIDANRTYFDKRWLVAVPGTPLELTMTNTESGVLHNVAIYSDKSAKNVVYRGEVTRDKGPITYSLPPLAEGTYFFRCDVHPDTMTGTLLVTSLSAVED